MTIERKKKFIIDFIYTALIVALVIFGFKYAMSLVLPFIIGFLLALIFQRPVAWLTKKTRLHRMAWSAILISTLFILFFVLFSFIGYRIYSEFSSFIKSLPQLIPPITEALEGLSIKFSGWLTRMPDGISDSIRSLPSDLASSVINGITKTITTLATSIAVNAPDFLLTLVMSLVAGIFITGYYNSITAFVLKQFNEKNRKLIVRTKQLFSESILKMMRGYLFIMFVTFCELILGLSLLRIDYAIIISLLVSLVDIMPVLGIGTVLLPWGIILIMLGDTWTGIELMILYIIITIIRNIIEPRIIGKQVGMHPLIALLSMYIGLKLFGIIGLFIFPIGIIILIRLQKSDMVHIWK